VIITTNYDQNGTATNTPIIVSLIDNQTSIAPEFNATAQEITSIVTILASSTGNDQLQQALL